MTRINSDGREIYEFELSERALARLNKYAEKNLYANHAKYDAMADLVCTPEGMVPSNPEYRSRMENTKKLREKLKVYTGSSEAASDLLYEYKTMADAAGVDFSWAAKLELDQLTGNLGGDTSSTHKEIKEVQPPILWKFWRYFLSRLSGGYFKAGEL
jgi:hypothetical protein